jgi:hypothetical protein
MMRQRSWRGLKLISVILEENEAGKIIFHKSLHKTNKKSPYPKMKRVQAMASAGGGVSSISTDHQRPSGGSLSARVATNSLSPNSPDESSANQAEPGIQSITHQVHLPRRKE